MSVRTLGLLASLTALVAAGCKFNYSISGTETEGDSDGTTTDGGTTQTLECPDPNSELFGDQCLCNPGYVWCNDDPDQLECCAEGETVEPPTGGTTTTGPTTGDPTGETVDPSGTTTGGTTGEETTTTGTTTGGEECMGEQLPPAECDPSKESFWCTMPAACGPEGGQLYRCVDLQWVLDASLPGDNCKFDGFDFAYGCVDDGSKVEFVCGEGPGTACEPGPGACNDPNVLEQCVYGKLTHYDCLYQCTEVGDASGTLYDFGSCGEQDGETVCLCCDEGDRDCPI